VNACTLGDDVKYLAIIFVSLLVGLGLGEIYLRNEFRNPDQLYVLPPLYKATYTPTATGTPGVVGGPHEFKTNRWGLRGEEIPETGGPVIYVMGGSTSIDIWLKEAWPDVLERILRATPGYENTVVINISKWGLSTIHNLMHFKDVVPYLPRKPDFVVVLSGVNDMQRALKTSYPEVITPEFDMRVAYHYIPPPEDTWYAKFGYYRLYKQLAEVQQKLRTGPLLGGGGDVNVPYRACRQAAKDENIVDALPPLEEKLVEYRNNLVALKKFGDNYGAKTVFATQPFIWQEKMASEEKALLTTGGLGTLTQWGECKGLRYYSPGAQQRALGSFNDVQRAVCREQGLSCTELEHTMPKQARYFYDDMHFTEAGAEFVAAQVKETIIRAANKKP
jgi:lysophospholipase L1-like esterase